MTTKQPSHWDQDALGRDKVARHLFEFARSRYLESKGESRRGAICFALDGEWGVGKTFFIERWIRDIELEDHPVFLFDAWKNDLSDDPLLSFLAAFRDALNSWAKNIPIGEQAAEDARQQITNFVRRAGRAIAPISRLILRTAVKKLTNITADEIGDAWASTSEENLREGALNQDSAETVAGQAFDQLFAAELESHSQRMRAVTEMKESLESLLTRLDQKAKTSLPLFVIIDELDRCRPDFAIKLLEGVKHLFDARGVVFVVSTNIDQLTQSIKAIYGTGFDSYRYLKRFFSFEYSLPAPSYKAYARAILENSSLVLWNEIVSGLPNQSPDLDKTGLLAAAFSWIGESLRLDLRSQEQVVRIAEAAAKSLDREQPLHALFLFSLSALRHVQPELLDRIVDRPHESTKVRDDFHALVASRSRREVFRKHPVQSLDHRAFAKEGEKQISLADVFQKYFEWSKSDLATLQREFHNSNSMEYPNQLLGPLVAPIRNGHQIGKRYPPSTEFYGELVRSAGQVLR